MTSITQEQNIKSDSKRVPQWVTSPTSLTAGTCSRRNVVFLLYTYA